MKGVNWCFVFFASSCFLIATDAKQQQPPNIVFVLADDVGWSDFGYNYAESPIPTPNIDDLAGKGIQLKQYYTHSLCTPARASIMTGRYHVNTGLTYVLSIGTPAGLSPDIPTLPSVLKKQGVYNTAMAGKWHLGHAQHKMTPIGHGFESFTGNYMWDVDSFTKQLYEVPWHPLMIDWISESANGSYRHYAEPLHATQAITVAAQNSMRIHAAENRGRAQEAQRQHALRREQQRNSAVEDGQAVAEVDDESFDDGHKPLFLYVAYTAAHSPLQPMEGHIERCAHIPHLWRRQYCGLVVGLDEGVGNLTATILEQLGENTIMVVTSDNGGSPWFGGLNAPFRGSKATPYEGGVKVPGLIVDFTADQRYLGMRSGHEEARRTPAGQQQSEIRVFNGLMHCSDWMPTLLSYAQVPSTTLPPLIDGFDFSEAFRSVPYEAAAQGGAHRNNAVALPEGQSTSASPRSEVLLEMYYKEDFIFGESLVALRRGDFKYIEGIVRDENYYYESSRDWLSMSSPSYTTAVVQGLIRIGEVFCGVGHFDGVRITATHVNLQTIMTEDQKTGRAPTQRLYNVMADPLETTNLALLPEHSALVAEMKHRLETLRQARPVPQQKVWMQFHMYDVWGKTHVKGDCSMNKHIPPSQCMFTHPWVSDDVDPFTLPGQVSVSQYVKDRTRSLVTHFLLFAGMVALILVSAYRAIMRKVQPGRSEDKETFHKMD